jgi:hypothetical protein
MIGERLGLGFVMLGIGLDDRKEVRVRVRVMMGKS